MSPSDAALHDVLDRLRAASAELDASTTPDEVAQRAADLALRLTRSTFAKLKLGDREHVRTVGGARPLDNNIARADLHVAGQSLGALEVSRPAAYTESERVALAIFATQVAITIDSAGRLRTRQRVERAHELAVQVLLAVSAHAFAGQSLDDFYTRLAATVADLVGARRVLFWRVTAERTLVPVHRGHGVNRKFIDRFAPTPCEPGGTDLASQVVYGDLIFRASRTDPSPDFAYVLETLGVDDAICVPWRAGEERLGLLAAYDSVRGGGFSREDTWVLQKAGLAAGLVTRLWHAQEDLKKTVDRLTKVDGARQMLLKNMTSVVDKERKRVVSELHDDALQKLTAAELQAQRIGAGGTLDQAALHKLGELLQQTEAALRRLVFDVRPPALETPDGLAQSIRDRLQMMSASGIEHVLDLDIPPDLSADDRSMIFREVAEAISNAERHSKARLVKVSLKPAEGGIQGVVEDDGEGFVVAERSNLPGHLGLLALRERALMAGGRYNIRSSPGAGTRIEFWIPLEK